MTGIAGIIWLKYLDVVSHEGEKEEGGEEGGRERNKKSPLPLRKITRASLEVMGTLCWKFIAFLWTHLGFLKKDPFSLNCFFG